MGNCKYCGKPAGLLRSKHPECEQQHRQHEMEKQKTTKLILDAIHEVLRGTRSLEELDGAITLIETTSTAPSTDRKELLIRGWETAVENFLEDGVLDTDEEKRLVEFKNRFDLNQSDLDKNGAMTKTAKAAVLRNVLNGVIPDNFYFDKAIPVNLQKGEQVVWAFPGSKYFEDKTRRQYVGGSRGVSIRVMKGVYYRAGAFKGHAVEHTERVHVDTGWVVITNKNIYFAGALKTSRIPYSKIVSFEPFQDGIGLMRDATNAKAQIFVTGDGWFTYNLAINLAQM